MNMHAKQTREDGRFREIKSWKGLPVQPQTLRRRDSTSTVRRISLSLPMTGSSLPSRAACVRSRPYFFRASPIGTASGATHGGRGSGDERHLALT